MKNFILVFFIFILLVQINNYANHNNNMDIIYPNGGEIYESGNLIDIKFTNNSLDEVEIYLWNGTSKAFNLLGTTYNNTFIWEIPEQLEGGRFRIKIISAVDSVDLYGYSDNFFKIERRNEPELYKGAKLFNLETEDTEIELFPNPANEMITIKLNSEIEYNYEIIDISGNIVFSGIGKNTLTLDISEFNAGTYFFKCYLNSNLKLKKFIIFK